RGGQQRQTALKTRELFGRCDLGGAVDGRDVGLALLAKFVVSVLKNRYQWARLELIGNRGYILQALGAAEGTQKTSALYPGTLERGPFGENHRPRKNTEYKKDEQHDLGHKPGLLNQIDNFPA